LAGHQLFFKGAQTGKMYYVSHGQMEYCIGSPVGMPTRVVPETYVSECCLWVVWKHRGRLDAEKDTELTVLANDLFCEVMAHTKWLDALCTYAAAYLDQLIEIPKDELSDLSQIDTHELVSDAFVGGNG